MAIPQWLVRGARAWFGHFNREELKKFILLGIIYGFIIGIYWTLRVVKDSVFISMVGAECRGYAKLLSLLVFVPLIVIYTKALERFNRHKMIYVLALLYAVATIVFGFLFFNPVYGLANTNVSPDRILAWVWYVFVESYGSLMPALFWAFAADVTDSDSAQRGFPFAIMVAQALSTIFLYILTPLAPVLGSSAYIVIFAGSLLFVLIPIFAFFIRTVPHEQLIGYKPAAKLERQEKIAHKKRSFFAGLKFLASQPYLFAILAAVVSYEIVIALIDFNFKSMVGCLLKTETECTAYLGENAIGINIISTLCLLLGASNIQRRLGLRVSLLVMPVVMSLAFIAFYLFPVINILFWITLIARGINYSVNSPSVKQLYVPTSSDVKYQAQAWIDTFGSRGGKAMGSSFTGVQVPLSYFFGSSAAFQMYLVLSGCFSAGVLLLWVMVALYLGKTYGKAVENKQVVC